MTDSRISRKELDEIMNLVESAEHIGDFHLKYGDIEVRLSRYGEASEANKHASYGRLPTVAPKESGGGIEQSAAARPPVQQTALSANMIPIKAPMVGTFYRAPSPSAQPFVEAGEAVEADTVVCIIEVMKLMNSIPAGIAGTVRQIFVDDAQPEQFGQLLLAIEPTP